jgi:hypothetical protein
MTDRHKELSTAIATRERELEALVARSRAELDQQRAELARLDEVIGSLGGKPASSRAPRRTRSSPLGRRPSRTRARRGENVAKIRVCWTSARVRARLSRVGDRCPPRVVSTALSKMKREGAAEGVDLGGGKLGYRLPRGG